MCKNVLSLLLLIPTLVLAQNFRKGALYEISPIPMEYAGQLVQLSELSGSWRIIDPFTHRAIRMADTKIEWGEENGSDELQKWTIKQVGNNRYTLSPTHSTKKLNKNEFIIKESSKFGSDDNCTYRFVSVKDSSFVLGNGDDGGNNARIVTEKIDSLNRGQYWTIKTLSPEQHVICNAFFNQYFDDGGDNASIDYLLQWPANPGNWGNAMMTIKPVTNKRGIYQIVSYNKQKMFVIRDGQMIIAEQNESDQNSWFYIVEVEKPKIKAPLWEDETIFEQNKLPVVANYTPYANENEMMADKAFYDKPWSEPQTSCHQSLDGIWNFDFVSSPDLRPDGLKLSNIAHMYSDFNSWDTIKVPGCWEMQGYDRPIYCNVEYPHSNTPPYINARSGFNDNGKNYGIDPVGTYQRLFKVSDEWLTKRTIIHFGGIYSAAFVYLNGEYVGYTQGSNNVAEFDISKHLRKGDNNLIVQVLRWCDGSYLECQDMFRMSGIFRSVYLYNVPATSIRDHHITSIFSDNYSHANLNVDLFKEGISQLGKVEVSLFSPNGKLVAKTDATSISDNLYNAKISVDNPLLWSAETPNLYSIHVVQYGTDGNQQMAYSTKYGFRDVRIKNSLLYVNGKRVFLKGVNRHDTDPISGRTVSTSSMEKDVLMMKQNNINTIRTSHYPNDVKMYSMFDYYGLYVCAEADLEDHANQSISDMPSWIPAFEDRISRMVGVYRNYPSILMWSLGNESGAGRNFKYCYDKAHAMDSLRPIHYEGTRIDKDYGGSAYSDFYSKMYPSINWMNSNTSNLDKPMFICEYAHAMGNAIGNLNEYWNIIKSSNSTIGGCIWDWVDQAIYEPKEIKQGIYRLHTGYDFPGPHQGNFCSNGIVTANRDYTSKLAEVRSIFQNIDFGSINNVGNSLHFSVKNCFSFDTLKDATLRYEYLVDGKLAFTNSIELTNLKPNDSTTVTIPQLKAVKQNHAEVCLNVYVLYGHNTRFTTKGDVMAKKQYVISSNLALANIKPSRIKLAIDSTSNNIVVNNKNIYVEFNKKTGKLTSLKFANKEILYANNGFEFNNHRWIENDRYTNTQNGLADEGTITITSHETNKVLISTNRKGTLADQQIEYTIYSNGIIDMDVVIMPHTKELRRAGLACSIDSSLNKVEYYALGPWENYCDRRSGSMVGRYTCRVDDLKEPYIKPQTTGDRCGLRELTLSDSNGFGIKIESEGNVSFSANRNTDQDYMNAKHQWQLTPQPYIYIHLDGAHRGLGNASCGPGPMEKYTISQSPIEYRLRISKL